MGPKFVLALELFEVGRVSLDETVPTIVFCVQLSEPGVQLSEPGVQLSQSCVQLSNSGVRLSEVVCSDGLVCSVIR